MTEDDIRGFFDALQRADFDDLERVLAEDVLLVFPGRRFGGEVRGLRRVRVFLRQNQRLFRGGLRFDLSWVGVIGDRAVAQWTNRGTTRDGRAYANRGVTLFREEGGKVVEIQDYLDTERVAETWPR
ncbi:MAG: nuclear transport factor 2 family protein [Acidobacteriota bacterium]|nr:nuclear transport factor 2 family protein [Acidobacteriota bacterium]MDQ7086962.1 nuclear transport factor 2 family protein [Acidobacteriota bacterium]